MANTTVDGPNTASAGLLARFFGVITSPRDTYQAIVANPRWLGMLAIAALSAAVLMGAFLSSSVGQAAWLDQMAARADAANPQQMQAMEKLVPYIGSLTAAGALVGVPLFMIVVAGILFAVFNGALGGSATFKQIFSVCVHTAPIGVLGQIFTVGMNYQRGSMDSATNLGVFLQMLEQDSFVANMAGAIDIFLVWQLFVLSIGLAVLYRRRTQPIATSFFVLYVVIAVIIGAVKSGSGA